MTSFGWLNHYWKCTNKQSLDSAARIYSSVRFQKYCVNSRDLLSAEREKSIMWMRAILQHNCLCLIDVQYGVIIDILIRYLNIVFIRHFLISEAEDRKIWLWSVSASSSVVEHSSVCV